MTLPRSQRRTPESYGRIGRTKHLRPRYHSLSTRKGLIDALDGVVSKLVRKRDGYKCITCPETRPEELTCSHFYKRAFLNTRWDLRNLACQCMRCNINHSEKSPWPYLTWLLKEISDDEFHELSELRLSRFEMTNDQLRALLESLKCQLRGMNG